jgi:RNA polymerase sigma-70 factor (ECF subfamily)
MQRLSDQDILRNVNIGNEEAFEFVFLTFYAELCIYAHGILRDQDSAEEIVQEVFVKLWENRKELSINISIKAYLYRAVHNQCNNFINHIQVEKRYVSESAKNGTDLVSPLSSDYPVANILVQELEEKINRTLSDLPKRCREVFLLIRHENLSYNEAAEKLGVSVNTIKTQLQQALLRLRENLKDYLPVL